MNAIGSHIFAGGFTLGVEKHFNVLAHFEGDGAYGADTFALNRPNIPVFSGPSNWPVKDFEGKVDFVYGNPPCAPWSTLGTGGRKDLDWRDDPRIEAWSHVFSLLTDLQPKALAIESVPRVFAKTGGRPMIESFTEKAIQAGYNVTHFLVDGQYTNLNHSRRRFFFMAHKGGLSFPRLNWNPAPTIEEVLLEVPDPGHCNSFTKTEEELVSQCGQGEQLRTVWEKLNPPETWQRSEKGRRGVKGRPQFMKWRLRAHKPAGVIAGGFYIHPTENRLLGHKELAHFSGYPQDYKWAGPPSGWGSLIARSVMPPVGEFVARVVKNSIASNEQAKEDVQLVDYTKPPAMEDLFA